MRVLKAQTAIRRALVVHAEHFVMGLYCKIQEYLGSVHKLMGGIKKKLAPKIKRGD